MDDKGSSSDKLSTLPPAIIETLLCLLSLKEAGRTSILSKRWRYTWTKISKLVFDEQTFKVSLSKNQLSNLEFLSVTSQVMSLHRGPIYEFALILSGNPLPGDVHDKIDEILAHLLLFKTVKKLHLHYSYKLPAYVYCLDQLKHLYLKNCVVNHLPTFGGFGNLRSLYLDRVSISKKALMHILSNNPSLKSFSLLITNDSLTINDESSVIELFKCLPLIEDFTACDIEFKYFVGHVAPRVLPVYLAHLKYLCIQRMYFARKDEMLFLVLMLRSSPSLEKLKLEVYDSHNDYAYNWEDYSDIWLDHLVDLEIRNCEGLKSELEFVKLILAKSPVLEKVRIHYNKDVVSEEKKRVAIDEEMKMLRFLLHFRRASPLVDIIVD